MEPVLLVITNLPDRESARKLAEGLVSERLAACANVLAECASLYWWTGAVESAVETPVLIKTRAGLYAEVQAYILAHHPYEVPEVIAVPVTAGHPAYLEWVLQETRSEAARAAGGLCDPG
ncbi:MAG TPA: divalent-cation tolerance protein CutA [Burkholderiales bacterium]|nr:divalent-cation tolerance protein CutA [Burkholderiales bacterium]